MKTLDDLRKEIDAIDALVMAQLNQRFSLMKAVKDVKTHMAMEVLDSSREQRVLEKTERFEYQKPLHEVYQLIIRLSKDLQHDT